MSIPAWHRYGTATRYALFDQVRNRTALLLLVFFVPAWYWLFQLVIPEDPLSFLFRAKNIFIMVNGLHLSP
jgi:hypothetical protein